jgi:hypothetical protein
VVGRYGGGDGLVIRFGGIFVMFFG